MPHELVEATLDAWNRHDGQAFASLLAEHGSFEDHGWGGATYSKQTVGSLIGFLASFSSDCRFTFLCVLQEGTDFVGEWEMRGTHDEDIAPFDIAATGKPIMVRGSLFLETDGKHITHARSYWSIFDLLHQVGAPIATTVNWGIAYMVEGIAQLPDE